MDISISYMGQMLPIKKLFSFQSQTIHSSATQFLMQSKLNSLQNGRCPFIFDYSTCSSNPPPPPLPPLPLQSPPTVPFLLESIFTSLFYFPTCSQKHHFNPHQHSFPQYLSHLGIQLFSQSQASTFCGNDRFGSVEVS